MTPQHAKFGTHGHTPPTPSHEFRKYRILMRRLLPTKVRDAETTILIRFAFWRGLGEGKTYGKLSKTLFFLGNSMTIKFGKFANFIVRNFVVIWEAPIKTRLTNVLLEVSEFSHVGLAPIRWVLKLRAVRTEIWIFHDLQARGLQTTSRHTTSCLLIIGKPCSSLKRLASSYGKQQGDPPQRGRSLSVPDLEAGTGGVCSLVIWSPPN